MGVLTVSLLVTLNQLYFIFATLPEKDYGSKLQDIVEKWHNTCLERSGTHEDIVQDLKQGKFPEDTGLKQYVVCMLRNSGVINKADNLNSTAAADVAPPSLKKEEIAKGAEICFQIHQNETDHVEHFYKALKCFHDADPQNFYFP